MKMDYKIEPCKTCESTEFEYNVEHCRNVCLRCNAMQEMTGIGVTTFEFDSGINYRYLQTSKVRVKRKTNRKIDQQKLIKEIKPFKLEDMFHWIFELQVEAMKPFVSNWDEYKRFSEILWQRYLKYSGSGFDIIRHRLDDIRLKQYPLGWGVPLDPNRVEATLNITPKVFFKKARAREHTDDSDMEIMKMKKNAKKLKIEKMVKAQFDQDKVHESDYDDTDSYKSEEHSDKEGFDLDDLNAYQIKKETNSSSSSSEESKLSDEDDESYIKMYEFKDNRQKKIARIMRKKKDCHVRYIGGRAKSIQLLMENNILLLFYTLHVTKLGTVNCCCLMDILRLAKRGDIPFLKITRFLPTNLYFLQHTVFQSTILRDIIPSFRLMKHYSMYLAETLELRTLSMPDKVPLIERMLKEYNLPHSITHLIDFIVSHVDSKVTKYYKIKPDSTIVETKLKWARLKKYSVHLLHPELCCMGYIFMAMRMLLRFDGHFEFKVSELAQEVERDGISAVGRRKGERLFVWTDWLRQSYRPPTISNAKSWEDLERVQNARAFLEEDLRVDNKFEDRLSQNDFVNSCGRYIQPYKRGTHEDVLSDLLAPLVEISAKRELKAHEPIHFIDFTGSCVQYLAAPEQYRADVISDLALHSQDSQSQGSTALTPLVDLIASRPLAWRKMALNDRCKPEGVFEELMRDARMAPSEHHLMDVMLYNTGVDTDLLHKTVDYLGRVMHRKR